MSYNIRNRIAKKNIGIVIPAFNEETNIEGLVKKIKSKFKNSLIIIVDDSHHKKTWHLILVLKILNLL